MKLKNIQVINSDFEIGQLSEQKVSGATAFKAFRLKQQLEQLAGPARQTLEGIGMQDQSAPEFQEVLSIEQEFEPAVMFEPHEIGEFQMTMSQIAVINHFIRQEEF